jgi:hypothetical protein
MTDAITFTKLRPPIAADPNTARPFVAMEGADVVLSYETQVWERNVTARILFKTVAMLRVGDPNDEGFYGGGKPGIINDSMYNRTRFPEIEWGEFYEVLGFDWIKGLVGTCYDEIYSDSSDPIVLIPNATPADGFRHFVFFMKDGTFECVCKGWEAANRT